jgi:hypothetical protein
MSGGHFDYRQFHIREIAEEIESIILNNGREKDEEELREERKIHGRDWHDKYPEEKFLHKHSDEVIEEFKKGLKILKLASIYAQRIDWLLSGDDSGKSFLERLKKELGNLSNEI